MLWPSLDQLVVVAFVGAAPLFVVAVAADDVEPPLVLLPLSSLSISSNSNSNLVGVNITSLVSWAFVKF